MTVRRGALLVDPARLEWPGDLLHEAGHIAVTNPAARASLDEVASDPAEEMAAIAWSYAAAVKIDLDPRIVFHDMGYRGGGAYLADAFLTTGPPGLPMLQWYGMTLDARAAKQQNQPAFPHMLRWLR